MLKSLKTDICEEHVFSKIFNNLSNDVYNFLRYKYGDGLDPRDKVQEAFIKLWDNCKKISPEKAKSFLFTTANNKSSAIVDSSPFTTSFVAGVSVPIPTFPLL